MRRLLLCASLLGAIGFASAAAADEPGGIKVGTLSCHESSGWGYVLGSAVHHFGYVGRPERAASGEGYPVAHAAEQHRIVDTAFNVETPISQHPRTLPGDR